MRWYPSVLLLLLAITTKTNNAFVIINDNSKKSCNSNKHYLITSSLLSLSSGVAVKELTENKNVKILQQKQKQQPAKALEKKKLSSEEIQKRTIKQLEKLHMKDQTSPKLSKEDLSIVYEDEHLIILNKPSGVLTVSGKDKALHSLAQAVFDNIQGITLPDADRMVVHRLGMDTSGLIVFAKTLDGVRGMNTIFRTRSIERTYEALVVGHIQNKRNYGIINLPLMRDYEKPPYMRISTEEHQEALIELDPEIVGKKLLELPKESITKYEIISKEEMYGQPITRVKLRSISGRTHQLNCHMAAYGHPIVGDTTYGIDGDALPNGGLSDNELQYIISNKNRASIEQQRHVNAIVDKPCCHAKSIHFRHPITNSIISITTDSPF